MQTLRKWLVAGLLIWVPLGVTLLVLRFLVGLLDRTLLLIPHDWRPDALLGIHIPGLGIILAILILLFTGMLFANLLGRRVVAGWERQLARIPFVRAVYKAAKQVAETLLATDSQAFRQVVLIHYPHPTSWALAFLTGNELAEIEAKAGRHLVPVFLPTTPNPSTGFILMVPRDDIILLDMSPDEALKMIVSLGVAAPQWPRSGQLPADPP